uniref:Matrix extracellular phosphoglycoprotein n=1 Tax=Propithecus coquereli TaxID=379532 RepID=A0A2K6H042_PROCO
MQVVCVGLLLFSVIWAAPTFQPQTEKTKQGCVEEQRVNRIPSPLQNPGFQNLPDPHPMPWPQSYSASGPATAGVVLVDPRCPRTKKTMLLFAIWTRE